MTKKNRPKFQGRMERRRARRKKRGILFWILLIPFVILGITAIGWGTYVYIKADNVISDSYENIGREKSDYRKEAVDPGKDNVSVLVMGVDENEHRDNKGASRTDALILATLNKEDKSIKLLSIPRDSYVYIPDRGTFDKINHAHYFGGTKSAIETVEHLLDIPVDYFVKVNFHAFIEVVDALGGVTVDVPYEFKESDSMDRRDTIHLLPGKQLLNGEEALAFARTRKHDNDIARGERQLEIIKAIISKSASFSSVLKFDDIIEAVGDNMSTNISFPEIRGFASYGSTVKNFNLDSFSLEGEDYWLNGIYYWSIDEQHLNETKMELKEHLGLESQLSKSGSETNGEDSHQPYDPEPEHHEEGYEESL